MNDLLRSALVIARRDYVATVWSKTFLLFLIGPLFPILFGLIFGSVGANIDREASRPVVAVVTPQADAGAIAAARDRIVRRIGDGALPELRIEAHTYDPKQLLADRSAEAVAVLSGSLARPLLTGPAATLDSIEGGIGLILDEARQGGTPAPVRITRHATETSIGTDRSSHLATARAAQLLLLMLTMILAGMLLSNLIEEKSNKVIEVLAAAVPVDAIFLGKLIGMLGMSLTGIAVWGGTAALALLLLAPQAFAALPPPAIGWPAFALLGVAYFTATYLLLGSVFLGIGGQASTVREVQTLSMPVTMAQLVVFAFASAGVGDPSGGLAIGAAFFPWSSPYAMLARAAQSPELWPHLLAIAWQALWVALTIRFAARHFRISVLKSGGGRGLFRRARPA